MRDEVFQDDLVIPPPTDWTSYFSEEHDEYKTWQSAGWYPWSDEHYRVCHNTTTAGLVSGNKCKGSYCDNISIECTQPVKYTGSTGYGVNVTNCGWTAWQSEEQGSRDFGWNSIHHRCEVPRLVLRR